KRDPGGEIMIHGRCVSAGCLSMSDERIQEIWTAATALRSTGGVVHVHILPALDMAGLIEETSEPGLRAFWENLREGVAFFEEKRRTPSTRSDAQGGYVFRGSDGKCPRGQGVGS